MWKQQRRRHIEQRDLLTDHHHAAFHPVVAGAAEFKIIGALQLYVALRVARKFQAGNADSIVQKKQVFCGTGVTGSAYCTFAYLKAVKPQPRKE